MIERELWEEREGQRTKYPGNFIPLKSVQKAKKDKIILQLLKKTKEKNLADKKKEQKPY